MTALEGRNLGFERLIPTHGDPELRLTRLQLRPNKYGLLLGFLGLVLGATAVKHGVVQLTLCGTKPFYPLLLSNLNLFSERVGICLLLGQAVREVPDL